MDRIGHSPYLAQVSSKIVHILPVMACRESHTFVHAASGGPGMCRRRFHWMKLVVAIYIARPAATVIKVRLS